MQLTSCLYFVIVLLIKYHMFIEANKRNQILIWNEFVLETDYTYISFSKEDSWIRE